MRREAVICLFVLLAIAASACDREGSLQDAVEAAVTNTREARSWHATGNWTTSNASGVTLEFAVELEFSAPDRHRSREWRNGEWTEAIVVGNDAYRRSSDEPQWCQSPCEYDDGRHVAVVTGSSWIELEILYMLVDLERLPDEKIGGLILSHYRGKVDRDSYFEMMETKAGEQLPEHPDLEVIRRLEIDVEVWIDADNYLRQTESEWRLPEPGLGDDGFTGQGHHLRFHEINEPIAIERPPL